jgi:hypothetical protein
VAATRATTEEEARVSYFADETLEELLKRGFDETHFKRLYRGGSLPRRSVRSGASPLDLYVSELTFWNRNFDEDSFDSLRRLESLLRHMNAGSDIEEALAAVLLEIPVREEIADTDLYWAQRTPSPVAAPAAGMSNQTVEPVPGVLSIATWPP